MKNLLLLACALLCYPLASAQEAPSSSTIRLPRDPVIAPDGASFVFAWQRDLWSAPIQGGTAERLTVHGADDERPIFSPDGERILFRSDRTGDNQLYIMPAGGGPARQVSFTSQDDAPLGFTADGLGILVLRRTDRGYHYSESQRVFLLDPKGQAPPRMLLDVGLYDAALSPDGKSLLFTRGRGAWYRKGYKGSQALQLWMADLATRPPTLRRLDADQTDYQNVSHLFPTWAPDGKSFFYVSDPEGTFDIFRHSLSDLSPRRVTDFQGLDGRDDGAAFLSVTADGKTMLLRRGFDLQRLDLQDGSLSPIALNAGGDGIASPLEAKLDAETRDIAFTSDGKQMAFVAGQDIYVMDRILKEPVQVTHTPEVESSLVFSQDGKRLYYVSEAGGEVDIWEATHQQEAGIWWLAEDFEQRPLTADDRVESQLQVSPKGDSIAYVSGTHIHLMDGDGSNPRPLVAAWSYPDFSWSPDGRWLTYATEDSDYNSDVFVVPIDGSREPFNLSRHPDDDYGPIWSGDGKRIAFTSQRAGDETDVYYIHLTKEEDESTERDRKMKEALEAMQDKEKDKSKESKDPAADDPATPLAPGPDDPAIDPTGDPVQPIPGDPTPGEPTPGEPTPGEPGPGEPGPDPAAQTEPANDPPEEDVEEPPLTIDFDGIHDRLHRISIPDSTERSLHWSPDGKTLLFQATIKAKHAVYQVEFPEAKEPTHFSDTMLGSATWLSGGKELVGQVDGRPCALSDKGEPTYFDFQVRWVRDWRAVRAIAFDQAWRAMRDRFYDPQLNHRDWPQIRAHYRPVAQQCLGQAEFSQLMNMMLGELNASHMGHRGGGEPLPKNPSAGAWQPTTYQLGLRFALNYDGPGWLVESVIPGSACHESRSQVLPGEILTHVDGIALDASVDLDRRLTLAQVRDVELSVLDALGELRTVRVRPTASVSGLLYEEFTAANRARVEELSGGTLGYLHIRGMNMGSFRQMEEDLFAAGHGKQGLVIDVRFNGGGSTADHVLTALTQPVHAITQARGSGEGYPQGRKIYASWSKPIVVLCNEHSFSNAEILAHAIKQIRRGTLVGMRTAGGVISTSSVSLLDGSSVRMPMRGWYLIETGQDMELNGCLPHIPLWNRPDGPDQQLIQAVSTLAAEVEAQAQEPKQPLVPAADLRNR